MVSKRRFLSYHLRANPRVSLKFIEAIFYNAKSRLNSAHNPSLRELRRIIFILRDASHRQEVSLSIYWRFNRTWSSGSHSDEKSGWPGFYFVVDHVLSIQLRTCILIGPFILKNTITLHIQRIYYLDDENSWWLSTYSLSIGVSLSGFFQRFRRPHTFMTTSIYSQLIGWSIETWCFLSTNHFWNRASHQKILWRGGRCALF